MRRHPLAQMLTIGAIASAVVLALALIIDWFPDRASSSAGQIDTLYDVLLIASVPIFVLVMTVAIYSVVRFRARPGDTADGAPIHGHTLLEVVWVSIPFLLVSGLAIYGWVVLNDIEAKQPNELRVNVTGQQFAWAFEYPAEKVRSNELVLPVDRPADFSVQSKDVIHSFWVPAFRLKSDAVPGLTTKIRLTPDRTGRFQVVCAELCGIGHATMRQSVRVLPPREFDRWVRQQGGRVAGDGRGGAKAAPDGKQIFASAGCASCHALSDAGASGRVGPDLNDLAAEAARFGRGRRQTPEQYVRESIIEPNAFVVPGFPRGVMPGDFRQQLSGPQLDALVKYLLTVGRGGKRR